MNRREFLQGALAIAAAALLPKAIEQPLAPLPAWSWNYSEEAGRRMMESLAAGINNYTPIMMVGGDAEMYYSQDGGNTWEKVGFWSNCEPSQEWVAVDKLIIETDENIDLSAYDSNFSVHLG